jgi:hypothetical protein
MEDRPMYDEDDDDDSQPYWPSRGEVKRARRRRRLLVAFTLALLAGMFVAMTILSRL